MKLAGLDTKAMVTFEDVRRSLDKFNTNLLKLLNGGLQAVDNVDSISYAIADSGAADTEIAITHDLGRVPVDVRIKVQDAASIIYDSGTTWTITKVYIKCDTANVAMTLHIE